MEMKICSKCRRELPLSEFYYRKDEGRHIAHCNSCESKYRHERYLKNKKTPNAIETLPERFYEIMEEVFENHKVYIQLSSIYREYEKEFKSMGLTKTMFTYSAGQQSLMDNGWKKYNSKKWCRGD